MTGSCGTGTPFTEATRLCHKTATRGGYLLATARTLGEIPPSCSAARFSPRQPPCGLAAPAITRAQARTEVQFWHAMPGALGEIVAEQVKRFNDSQATVTVVPSFKGSYTEAMTGAIAAWRAGNAPHILQVFEVGTATMMAAGPRHPPGAPAAGRQRHHPGPEALPRRRPRLLQRYPGAADLHAAQLLLRHHVAEPRCLRQGRAVHHRPAEDLGPDPRRRPRS